MKDDCSPQCVSLTQFSFIAGASALWALAGVTRHQQQRIASMIGINILVDMLMMKSETLQFIAGMAIVALTTENIENQNRVVAGGGVQPLVRLLRSPKTSEKVRLTSFSVKHLILPTAMVCFHRTTALGMSSSSLREEYVGLSATRIINQTKALREIAYSVYSLPKKTRKRSHFDGFSSVSFKTLLEEEEKFLNSPSRPSDNH